MPRTGRKLDSHPKTFEGLKQAAEKSVAFEKVTLTVGPGAQAVQVMVGEIQVNAAFIETILKTVLEKFEPTTATCLPCKLPSRIAGRRRRADGNSLGQPCPPARILRPSCCAR